MALLIKIWLYFIGQINFYFLLLQTRDDSIRSKKLLVVFFSKTIPANVDISFMIIVIFMAP